VVVKPRTHRPARWVSVAGMSPHPRKPDAVELGRRIWDYIRVRAGDLPGEFPQDTRDGVTGWLWEGAFAALIREAVPGIADPDLRRAREYLNACDMVVNVGGLPRGGGQPQWFIRADWHQGPGGHVHMVAAPPASQPAGPGPGRPVPGTPAPGTPAPGIQAQELAGPQRQDIVQALQSLAQQVSGLQSDNERLRADNDRLYAEIERIRVLMHEIGEKISRQAGELLAGAGDRQR
jgi:hypothetical protein